MQFGQPMTGRSAELIGPVPAERPFLVSATIYLTAAVLLGGFLILSMATGRGFAGSVRWVHVHLALIGAVSMAMLGSVQFFGVALVVTAKLKRRQVLLQVALSNAGVIVLAAGVLAGWPWLAVAGGTGFLLATILVMAALIAMSRQALAGVPFDVYYYLAAVVYGIIGMAVGILLVGQFYLGALSPSSLRLSHIHLTVLGWVGLTIIGTIHTFYPTVVRGQLNSRSLVVPTFWLVGAGTALLSAGMAVSVTWLTLIAGLGVLAGVGLFTYNVIATQRAAQAFPAAGKHLFAATLYLVLATLVGLALVGAHASGSAVPWQILVLYAHLGLVGWIIQTLMGAMDHLLPVVMGIMAMRASRGTSLSPALIEKWAGRQFWLLNAGVWVFAIGLLASAGSGNPWLWLSALGGGLMLAAFLVFIVTVGRAVSISLKLKNQPMRPPF